MSLATLVRGPPEPHHLILQFADVDPQVWCDLELRDLKWKPWQLGCGGIDLSLPTLAM